MITNEQYDLCRAILGDSSLQDDEKVEQLEDKLKKETTLTGDALDGAILDALWRHRNAEKGEEEYTPRHNIVRKSSPAPWQINRAPTPLGSPPSSSPALSHGFPTSRPGFARQRSAASPFVSPRPSPRLALAQTIPHSPNLNTYEFSDTVSTSEIYGDYGSDNVDWLVGDDTASNASSTGTASLSAAAPEWTPQPDMNPYDILRSVFGDQMSDEQIESALNEHSHNLSATIAALLDTENTEPKVQVNPVTDGGILVGKNMLGPQIRPGTPGSAKSPIVCKYWLASGSCLRADCRFAHDTSGYLCKYWMNGQCLAGDKCQFSHDPALVLQHLNVNDSASSTNSSFTLSESSDQFPSLSSTNLRGLAAGGSVSAVSNFYPTLIPSAFSGGRLPHINPGIASRPHSRPSSRHQNRPLTPSSLSMDDPDAFPTLGSLNTKRSSKHHGHRSRHGHGGIDRELPSSLADVVKMSPSPAATKTQKIDPIRKARTSGEMESAAAKRIPEPLHIPWLETGNKANQQYLAYRAEAIKHGSIRNKFLQSAAQAWNRNDARAAKALSLRGQAENDEMRKAHRAAAKALYEERNQHLSSRRDDDDDDELYIDLHGLHPEEAVEYLKDILRTHEKKGRRVIYAITGTGHHSKNGKDKVGKGVRTWLNEWGYTFREFSVPGERGGYIGGVLGIDITSHRRQPVTVQETPQEQAQPSAPGGKVQVLKRE